MATFLRGANPGAQIGRAWRQFSSVSLTSGALGASGDAIDMRSFAGGIITGSSTCSATTLTFFHSAATSTGPFRAAYDKDGTAVTLTVAASRATELPTALFGAAWVRVQADTAASFEVVLKG